MDGGVGVAGRGAVPATDALKVPKGCRAVPGDGAWGHAGHPQGTCLQQKPSADVGESQADVTPNTSWPKGHGQLPPRAGFGPCFRQFLLFIHPCSHLSAAEHPPAPQPASTSRLSREGPSPGCCREGSPLLQLPMLLCPQQRLPAPASTRAALGAHLCACVDKTGVVSRAERHVLGCRCLVKSRSWLKEPVKNSPSCNDVKY